MCLAIYKPSGARVSKKRLSTAFRRNPHGAGFAYAKNGKVTIKKGFFSFEAFWKSYRRMSKDRAMLIHFRWATHGAHTKDNCHPFRLTPTTAMIHNGTIHGVKVANEGSDTSNFCDRMLRPLMKTHPKFIYTNHGRKILGLAIGDSKIVIMDADGSAVICNENKGHWDNDCWYSNESYKPRRSHSSLTKPRKAKGRAHSQEILGSVLSDPVTDYHATNRAKGRSWIDDLEEQAAMGK